MSDFEALNSKRESVDMASFAGSCQGCLDITLYALSLSLSPCISIVDLSFFLYGAIYCLLDVFISVVVLAVFLSLSLSPSPLALSLSLSKLSPTPNPSPNDTGSYSVSYMFS